MRVEHVYLVLKMDHSSDILVKKRIYVGNLPFDTTEDEIRSKFSEFGNVMQVEMKYRSDTSFDMGLPCFAFLDLKINANRVNTCFRELAKKEWRGNFIKLELARESILSRLERERAQQMEVTSSSSLVSEDTLQSRPSSGSESKDHLKDSAADAQHSIHVKQDSQLQVTSGSQKLTPTRKKHKSKDRIDGLATNPEHIFDVEQDSSLTISHDDQDISADRKKTKVKAKENKEKEIQKKVNVTNKLPKKLISEEKRINSLMERQKSVLQQKDAIKLALSSVDERRTNNRVIFDEDEVKETSTSLSSGNKPRYALFDEDDGIEQPVTLQIKKQFKGKKGQKLLDLQSQYAADQRFSLDERFYESDDEEPNVDCENEEVSANDEMNRQLEILQSIVGEHLPQKKSTTRQDDTYMLRYDPTIAEHGQYEKKGENQTSLSKDPLIEKERKKKRKEEKSKKKSALTSTTATVSKEKYYKVSETLKESLKSTESSGFSLLQMFGTAVEKSNDEDEHVVDTDEDKHAKLSAASRGANIWSANPFKYDSSETEDDNDEPLTSYTGPKQQTSVSGESFFFKLDDIRLHEGVEFFSVKSTSAEGNFSDHRRELRMILSEKVRHNARKARLWSTKKVGGSKFTKRFSK